jgi:hypothetical protein
MKLNDWQADVPDPVLIFEIKDPELPIKLILDVGNAYDRLILLVTDYHPAGFGESVIIRTGYYSKNGWNFFHEDDEWTYERDDRRYTDLEPHEALCWFAYMNLVSLTQLQQRAFHRHKQDAIWRKIVKEMIEYVELYEVITD